jgi:hypothetical protein
MQANIPLRCSCGRLRGEIQNVAPECANFVVCCCSGCQRYARFLNREDALLDEYGGTKVFQVSPASIKITDGMDQLTCLQQTHKGALRWYAACCRTPILNTMPTSGVPFSGVLMDGSVDHEALAHPIEAIVGPLRVTVNGKIPREKAQERKATVWALLKMIFRFSCISGRWWWRGDHKRSIFFDAHTGQPILAPEKLYLRDTRE